MRNNIEEKARKRSRQPKVRWTLGKFGKWFFILLMIGQSLVGAEAASDEARRRSGQMTRMQKGTEVKLSSWEKAIPKRSRQEDCEGRTGMQKESKMVRCPSLYGSIWSTVFF